MQRQNQVVFGFGKSVDKNTKKNISADELRIQKDRIRTIEEKTLDAKITKLGNIIHKNDK